MKETYSDDKMLCFMQGFECPSSENNYAGDVRLKHAKKVSLQLNRSDGRSAGCGAGGGGGGGEEDDDFPQRTEAVKRSFSDRFFVAGDVGRRRGRGKLLTIRKTRSTGNFVGAGGGGGGGAATAAAAPCSAPATPHQLEPHFRHQHHLPAAANLKPDKNAVKQLSHSAPSVRARGGRGGGGGGAGSGEGDSGESKAPSKTPSKTRQKKFLRHFPQVGPDERVLNYYSCALVGDILLQGHLYITKNYFAFYSNVFGYVTKLLIPTASVLRVSKEKMARIIPNAVGVCTRDERHVFGSLLSRDSTYKLMLHVWQAAAAPEQAAPEPQEELRVSEVELDASEYSPEDESSSGGGESTLHPRCTRRAQAQPPPTALRDDAIMTTVKSAAVIQPTLLLGASGGVGIADPRAARGGASSVVSAVLILLALCLAASALTLAHTMYRQRQFTTFPTQSELSRLRSADMYGELLAWQARLHSQAATEVHSFLNTNLLLLAKVRQSLEALSTMILTDAGKHTVADDVLQYESARAPSSDNQQQPGVS